jgi:hypothetical protein
MIMDYAAVALPRQTCYPPRLHLWKNAPVASRDPRSHHETATWRIRLGRIRRKRGIRRTQL